MSLTRAARCNAFRLVQRTPGYIRYQLKSPQVRWGSTSASFDGPPITDTNRVEATQKRFWNEVGIERHGDGFVITLDKRPLKTSGGQTLLLPSNKSLAAALIAAEWDHQETLIKPHALPMTSIVSRALDAMQDPDTSTQVRESLLNYLNTDTVCFFHDNPEPLVRLQTEHWTPLLEWAKRTFDIKISVSNSILPSGQPEETHQELRKVLESFNQWEMAAIERATYASKSLIIGLAVVKKYLTVEQAACAASVEVNSQIERWGEVEDTHDVDYQDIRRQIGSAACLLATSQPVYPGNN